MPDYEHFDTELIIHINTIFMILCQLGVGPAYPFQITGPDELWTDFISDEAIPMVKSYMGIRVRKLFDPPVSSSAEKAIDEQIDEFEWRMLVFAESASYGNGNTISVKFGLSQYVELEVIDSDGNEILPEDIRTVEVIVADSFTCEKVLLYGEVIYKEDKPNWHIRASDTTDLGIGTFFWNAKAELNNGDIIDIAPTARFIIHR